MTCPRLYSYEYSLERARSVDARTGVREAQPEPGAVLLDYQDGKVLHDVVQSLFE